MQSNIKKPDIVLVDDHMIFRQGIKAIINFEDLGTVIGEASNGKEFIEMMSIKNPDLVLMDIDMPGMNGFEATKRALEINSDLKIIVFTIFDNEECFKKMVELGAKGFILKTSGLNELEMAIEKVMDGGQYFSNEFSSPPKDDYQDNSSHGISKNEEGIHSTNNKMLFFPWMSSRQNFTNI